MSDWPGPSICMVLNWKLMHTYGLRPDLLATSRVWRAADGRQEFVVAAKGAPEAIADLCRLERA